VGERLDAFLAHAGLGSRSDVKKLVRAGRVALDGVVARDPAEDVRGRTVTCDGEPVVPPRTGVVLVMHKPVGVSCSHDPAESPLVFELLPQEFRGTPLECVGRLDRDTSGLLLLTDDGALNHRLTAPRKHVLKRYVATFEGRLAGDAEKRFAEGILLKNEESPTLPAKLTVLAAPTETRPGRAVVELAEGRYHQVRRMLAACGATVVKLVRTRIGGLDLPDDLALGDVRELGEDERTRLFQRDD
jgi:16S rRNA pseudouridine516 synthase